MKENWREKLETLRKRVKLPSETSNSDQLKAGRVRTNDDDEYAT